MKRSSVVFGLTAMLAGTSLVGCKLMDDDFASSTPTAENVALDVPASTQRALTAGDGTKVSALLGEEASSYQLTRAVTGIVNGARRSSASRRRASTATRPSGDRTASRSTRTPGG